MGPKSASRCEPVELKPVKYNVPQIPPYLDAKASDLPVTLDNSIDPNEYRCSLADMVGGELPTGTWKHSLIEDDLETALQYYKKEIRNADWFIAFEDSSGEFKVIYARQKAASGQQNLVAFLFRDAESTHLLAGFRKS